MEPSNLLRFWSSRTQPIYLFVNSTWSTLQELRRSAKTTVKLWTEAEIIYTEKKEKFPTQRKRNKSVSDDIWMVDNSYHQHSCPTQTQWDHTLVSKGTYWLCWGQHQLLAYHFYWCNPPAILILDECLNHSVYIWLVISSPYSHN